jgi:hypothetical protein
VSTMQDCRCIACSTGAIPHVPQRLLEAAPVHRPRRRPLGSCTGRARRPTATDSPPGTAVRVTSSRPACPGSRSWTASGPSR